MSCGIQENGSRYNDLDVLQNKEARMKTNKQKTECRGKNLRIGLEGGGVKMSVIEPRVYGQVLVPLSNSGTCCCVHACAYDCACVCEVEYECLDCIYIGKDEKHVLILIWDIVS